MRCLLHLELLKPDWHRAEAEKGSEEKETELLHKNDSYTSLVSQILRHEITLPIEDAYLD